MEAAASRRWSSTPLSTLRDRTAVETVKGEGMGPRHGRTCRSVIDGQCRSRARGGIPLPTYAVIGVRGGAPTSWCWRTASKSLGSTNPGCPLFWSSQPFSAPVFSSVAERGQVRRAALDMQLTRHHAIGDSPERSVPSRARRERRRAGRRDHGVEGWPIQAAPLGKTPVGSSEARFGPSMGGSG